MTTVTGPLNPCSKSECGSRQCAVVSSTLLRGNCTKGQLLNYLLLVNIGGGRGQWLGGTMASAEHERITGVWGQSPQRGPGAEPLVRGAKLPWSWKHFGHWMSNGAGKFSTSSWKQYVLLRSTVGGPRVHGAPRPRHWGAGSPPRLHRLCLWTKSCLMFLAKSENLEIIFKFKYCVYLLAKQVLLFTP